MRRTLIARCTAGHRVNVCRETVTEQPSRLQALVMAYSGDLVEERDGKEVETGPQLLCATPGCQAEVRWELRLEQV